ncbi:mersacidin/lichenicidin family type 2 lantibiotic [Archangium sp.]|jgi:mersacidin/lichenicidin family type 2 lantibiotic|uniref:mersacidin/lichenicidin family type 2 lantibiotic n=1 Tax=Archangium sp. TaxID=1872627 RepID=UPI002EDAA528
MKKEMIIRAWKDPAFRASLTREERATLPESPSGRSMTELDESELLGIIGGRPLPLEPNTGCTDGRPTCGIINCTLLEASI